MKANNYPYAFLSFEQVSPCQDVSMGAWAERVIEALISKNVNILTNVNIFENGLIDHIGDLIKEYENDTTVSVMVAALAVSDFCNDKNEAIVNKLQKTDRFEINYVYCPYLSEEQERIALSEIKTEIIDALIYEANMLVLAGGKPSDKHNVLSETEILLRSFESKILEDDNNNDFYVFLDDRFGGVINKERVCFSLEKTLSDNLAFCETQEEFNQMLKNLN